MIVVVEVEVQVHKKIVNILYIFLNLIHPQLNCIL
jgi:hypothetical protein